MSIKSGDRFPDVTLQRKTADGIESVTTSDLLAGKKVVIFAVPGAFTPTCSAKHLPGFVNKADEILAKGVDTIACVSVNDAFVMDAWGNDQHVGHKVMMLADGSADLARALGLELDLVSRGMGVRSGRYAMIVDNGTISDVLLEDAGAFEVSSAESVLARL